MTELSSTEILAKGIALVQEDIELHHKRIMLLEAKALAFRSAVTTTLHNAGFELELDERHLGGLIQKAAEQHTVEQVPFATQAELGSDDDEATVTDVTVEVATFTDGSNVVRQRPTLNEEFSGLFLQNNGVLQPDQFVHVYEIGRTKSEIKQLLRDPSLSQTTDGTPRPAVKKA